MRNVGFGALCFAAVCCCSWGCAFRAPYPASWPERVLPQSDRCPDLSGSYQNYGTLVEDKSGTEAPAGSLQTLFGFPEQTKHATRITLEMRSPRSLEVFLEEATPMQPDGATTESRAAFTPYLRKSLREGKDYDCEKDGLAISRPYADEPDGGIHEAGRITAHFSLAADGSLIVKEVANVVGVVLTIVPAATRVTVWKRFGAAPGFQRTRLPTGKGETTSHPDGPCGQRDAVQFRLHPAGA